MNSNAIFYYALLTTNSYETALVQVLSECPTYHVPNANYIYDQYMIIQRNISRMNIITEGHDLWDELCDENYYVRVDIDCCLQIDGPIF